MSAREATWLVIMLAGGLAVFVFGMQVMSEALRRAAGGWLRRRLRRATRGRWGGLAVGAVLGAMVQSSAATVMLVGLVNAGILTLGHAVAPVIGANIGTTLSMQVIALDLDRLALVAVALGLLLSLTARREAWRQAGRGLVGFGLLFMGIRLMGDAVHPHRAALAPLLGAVRGEHWTALAAGTLLSVALTGVVQSSGAVIGTCFALARSGVFTDLSQVYPVVIGAHIGTCVTALLGSLGTRAEARRVALAHLAFNVCTSLMALAAYPWVVRAVRAAGGDLVRQTANLHTLVMVGGAVVWLPLAGVLARVVTRLRPDRPGELEGSHLDPDVIDRPEQAICALLRELNRAARVCLESLRLNRRLHERREAALERRLRLQEDALDEIKRAARQYIVAVTRRHLSRRQSIFLREMDACMADLERIGDHVDALTDLLVERGREGYEQLEADLRAALLAVYAAVERVLELLVDSLACDGSDAAAHGRKIAAAVGEAAQAGQAAQVLLAARTAAHSIRPLAGVCVGEYLSALDRIGRHAGNIAALELTPDFHIKAAKLDRVAALEA